MEDEDSPCWLSDPHGLTSLVINLYGRRCKWDLPIERLLMHLPRLKHVRLHPGDYTDMAVVTQALMRHCTNLTTIQLLAEPGEQEDSLFQAPGSHSLSVSDEASVPSLVRPILVIHGAFLTHLHLYTPVDIMWILLKDMELPRLVALRLDGIFAVDCRRHLPAENKSRILVEFLKRHPTLTRFAALRCDPITDEAIGALQLGSLVALELDCARLTEDGLLAILAQAPRLRTLCLDDMACVTDAVLAQIDHMPYIDHLSLYGDNKIDFSETLFRFLDHHVPRYRVCKIRCGSGASPPPAHVIQAKLNRIARQWHFIYEQTPHAQFLFLDHNIEPRYVSTS
ncbi:hypothetical protein BX666DRAFT_1978594 [Dichotomocladium elegans]|nr:hypothetical protein BX666DRAFT_1978594 [Dichotomocladium elegans]